jgi:hypothetical protein
VIDDQNRAWTEDGLLGIGSGMKALSNSMGEKAFQKEFTGVVFSISTDPKYSNIMYTFGNKDIHVNSNIKNDQDYIKKETVHEFAHILDNNCNNCMGDNMAVATGSTYNPSNVYTPKGTVPSTHAAINKGEDFAESMTAVVFPGYAGSWGDPIRINYINQVFSTFRGGTSVPALPGNAKKGKFQ